MPGLERDFTPEEIEHIEARVNKTLAPPVLGWSSAIASFGAFLIPKFFATAIQAGTPENPFFIFAAYYATCLAVNWWYYFRKGAEKPC